MKRHYWILLALAATASTNGCPNGSLHAAHAEQPAETAAIRLVPSPPKAAAKELMRRWHREYRGQISPVLREWRILARAARERPGSRLAAGCRSLELALGNLDREILPLAPDPSISLHLGETLRSLADATRSCTHGAYFLTTWRLHQADNSWRELRGRLLLYGLEP